MTDNHDPNGAYSEVFEEGKDTQQSQTIHRIRANSSIMQLKKILGEYQFPASSRLIIELLVRFNVLIHGLGILQWPIEEKSLFVYIFRTAHELSLQTVAVFSYEDRLSMHRQKADEAYVIGKRGQYTPVGAYLAGDEIIKIALQHNVQMIHPGYGFLSENAEFARNVEKAGLIFVGPSPEVIDSLGDKVSARTLAIKAGVPVVPGTEGAVDKFEDVKKFTDEYGFPIIIKAAYGGGGRGMRVVREQKDLEDSFQRATSEAKSAFGNGTVFVERFLDKPKHIEVQLLGDNHGNIVHLYERDCSVQRRHQKVVELAPAKDLPAETRDNLLKDAVKLARSVNYRNAGTAEFLVDQQNRYYFIEINPRIQVEHTITEEITGIDLIAAQIQIAAGATLAQLGLTQDRISTRGFAIQCRITTEDPSKGFSPDTGKIEVYRSAGGNGVRLDGGNGFGTLSTMDFLEYILVLVWAVLTLTPDRLKNPALAVILTTQDVVDKLMSSLTFAPGLLDVVRSSTPPPMSFFKTLPTKYAKLWAVYALTLEKHACKPKLYIGNSTHSESGVYQRLRQYDTQVNLPVHVRAALDDGYEITHKGLLCWSPIPGPLSRFPLRVLFLALEASFAVLFWAFNTKEKDYGLPKHLCPWPIGSVDWDGLCSHNPLKERLEGDTENLTPEEIEAKAKNQHQRKLDYIKDFSARAKAERKYPCETCNIAFESKHLLGQHKLTKRHIDWVNGIIPKATKPKAATPQTAAAKLNVLKIENNNKVMKKYYCKRCDYNAPNDNKLVRHRESKKHINHVAESLGKALVPRKNAHIDVVCQLCDFTTNTNQKLALHMESKAHINRAAEAAGEMSS
ncbi:hypothetical protein VTL71DRAFT_4053 [Oculimacula yallundae]|uniref:Pyruvate carboxylase n=1 Tax=Oculimacula yallundae TaxID=86028 RepID=A0ABR4C724_9HELO